MSEFEDNTVENIIDFEEGVRKLTARGALGYVRKPSTRASDERYRAQQEMKKTALGNYKEGTVGYCRGLRTEIEKVCRKIKEGAFNDYELHFYLPYIAILAEDYYKYVQKVYEAEDKYCFFVRTKFMEICGKGKRRAASVEEFADTLIEMTVYEYRGNRTLLKSLAKYIFEYSNYQQPILKSLDVSETKKE